MVDPGVLLTPGGGGHLDGIRMDIVRVSTQCYYSIVLQILDCHKNKTFNFYATDNAISGINRHNITFKLE